MHVVALALALVAQAPKSEKKPADPNPVMCKRGELVFEESFKADAFPGKTWSKYKGNYVVEKDQVKVAEIASDAHHPACSRKLNQDNVIIQFNFKMDGAKWMGVALDGKEHIARAFIYPDAFRIMKMTGMGGTTKGFKIDEFKMKFEPGTWHTMLVEIYGNEMVAQVDSLYYAFGAAEGGGIDTHKDRIELISGGEWAWYDEMKVWAALPDDKWAGRKQVLLASRKK